MLLANWRAVASRAWSMRLLYLSILFGVAELVLPFFESVLPLDPGAFLLLILITNVAAALSRLVVQRKLKE